MEAVVHQSGVGFLMIAIHFYKKKFPRKLNISESMKGMNEKSNSNNVLIKFNV